MERRNFLKGIFGAAVVAAMPKAVVDQIEQLPTNAISPSNKKTKDIDSYTGSNVLFIYNKDTLIGVSTHFSIIIRNDRVSIPFEILQAPKSTRIEASNIYWEDIIDLKDILMSDDLSFLAKNNDIKLAGNIEISQIELGYGIDTKQTSSATFEVLGEAEITFVNV